MLGGNDVGHVLFPIPPKVSCMYINDVLCDFHGWRGNLIIMVRLRTGAN